MIRNFSNKLALVFVALFTTSLNAQAHALPASQTVPVLSCHEKGVFDAGHVLNVSFETGTGLYQVRGGQDSIAGLRERYVARARLVPTGNRTTTYVYRVEGVEHMLRYFRNPQEDKFSAALSIEGRDAIEMACYRPAIHPRPFEIGMTCMAYFTGFVFDSASQACVEQGRSGCSDPFEFQTQQECESAAFGR